MKIIEQSKQIFISFERKTGENRLGSTGSQERWRKQKAMLIPEMELHHSLKPSGFAEVNICWWTLLFCQTTTVGCSQLPDFSGKTLLVSIPHTCSAESSCLKCVASLLRGFLAMAVQREVSVLGDSKDCDVQRKLQQCYILNGTARNRRVRG